MDEGYKMGIEAGRGSLHVLSQSQSIPLWDTSQQDISMLANEDVNEKWGMDPYMHVSYAQKKNRRAHSQTSRS